MQLNLKNPLIIFDLETTGMNIASDRIVEISYLKVSPNGKEECKTLRINPGMPIPPQSTEIHGISDADVADCPTFLEVAKNLAKDFEGCDLGGYNSNRFDIPTVGRRVYPCRCGYRFDETQVYRCTDHLLQKEPRTLSAAFKFYCDGDLENAHKCLRNKTPQQIRTA